MQFFKTQSALKMKLIYIICINKSMFPIKNGRKQKNCFFIGTQKILFYNRNVFFKRALCHLHTAQNVKKLTYIILIPKNTVKCIPVFYEKH